MPATRMQQNDFFSRIDQFNAMYQMQPIEQERQPMRKRLYEFEIMLKDEVEEVEDIYAELTKDPQAARVAMADWLGDIIVYCASEAKRWGIPIEQVLQIIMDSNASKLQADGTALFVNGKLQKGPNYWKPEPKIKELLK